MNNDRNVEYNKLAHQYIPGGAHTYSRGDDQYPSNAPKILSSGQGAYVWDVDQNKFLDFGMALRAVTLGYNREEISRAAIAEILNGNNLTRASQTEVLAAKEFCEFIPWVEMVKFGKNGSNVVTAATKLARAYTGRKLIARCADHPFYSFDDWFIGDTVVNSGVPSEIKNLTLKFAFNDLTSVEELFIKYPNQIACIVTEPATSVEPKPGFLKGLIDIAHSNGAIVIFDEMITGFRWHNQGACAYYDVKPDLVTFGKAMANGFSVAALGGKKEIMELGGLKHDKERVFLMSTTHGGEMCSLGALRATISFYKANDVVGHLWRIGKQLIDGLNQAALLHGIEKYFVAEGTPCSPSFVCKDIEGNISLPLRTLFMQEMVAQGVLIPWISLSFSHTKSDIDFAIEAASNAFSIYKKALELGSEKYLVGASVKPVFRKFN